MINKISNIHIKPLTIDEMVLALDRISRFKYPEKKLKRVYIETICSNLIIQNIKKTDIELMNNSELINLFTKIWNFSILHNFKETTKDINLNKNYYQEENRCYFLSDEINDLMPMEADFNTLVNNVDNVPNDFINYSTPRKIVLTEGVTEEILLPVFSKILGYDWDINNVKIIGLGGKNRILSQYNVYKKILKIPIFILLDNDAKPVYDQLLENIRDIDSVYLISSGEIEDIIPIQIFKKAINSEYKMHYKVSIKDFKTYSSMVKTLTMLYKDKGFGEFKKAKMANLIKNISNNNLKLSDELTLIINKIKSI